MGTFWLNDIGEAEETGHTILYNDKEQLNVCTLTFSVKKMAFNAKVNYFFNNTWTLVLNTFLWLT